MFKLTLSDRSLVEAALGSILAIDPLTIHRVCDALNTAFTASLSQRFESRPIATNRGDKMIIHVHGIIVQRDSPWTVFLGGSSTTAIYRAIESALNNSQVKEIILDIDSPGGGVYGISELAIKVRQARQRKPIIAVVNSLAASAAYWIASSASEIVITPGGEAGGIGVVAVHVDRSVAMEKSGQKVTLVHAGRYKVEGNTYEPLGGDARAYLQQRADQYHDMFIADVARGRGVAPGVVRKGFGQGRTVGAADAVRSGLVDRIGTLDEVLRRTPSRPSNRVYSGLRAGAMTAEIVSAPTPQLARALRNLEAVAQNPAVTTVTSAFSCADAWHEAGHAVAAIALGGSANTEIYSTPRKSNYVTFRGHTKWTLKGGGFHEALTISMAGGIVEGRFLRTAPEMLPSWEYDVAACHVKWTRANLGPDSWDIQRAKKHATDLITRHWRAIHRVADRLMQAGHLDHDEMKEILERGSE